MGRRKEIPNLIKKAMLMLAGIQVVLGAIWMIGNVTYLPDYQETTDMVRASQTLLFDEYMGILYPLLLRVFAVFGDRFYIPVYFVQLGIAVWSYYSLLRGFVHKDVSKENRVYLWLATGYFVTFPMILQCHMSILPYSLASSLLVFLIAEINAMVRKRENIPKKRILSICILWVLIGLLIPDYGVIAFFLVVPGVIIAGWKQGKRMIIYISMVILTIVVMFTTLTLTQTPGSYGRMQRSVSSVLLTRFAWPYFERDGFYWDHKKWIEFSEGELAWVSTYPENTIYILGPKIESVVGKEQAQILYGEMAKLSFSLGKKDALKALGRDFLANAGGPFALQYQLSGRGVSYTGWNYYQMQGNTPGLTKYFVMFSMYAFDFLFVSAFWIYCSMRKRIGCTNTVKRIMPAMLALGFMVLWYTMIGNGMQDYLKVIPVLVSWCLLPMSGLGMLTFTKTEESVE